MIAGNLGRKTLNLDVVTPRGPDERIDRPSVTTTVLGPHVPLATRAPLGPKLRPREAP